MNKNQDPYIKRVLRMLSQAGNTIAVGDTDVSISARIGYNYLNHRNLYWSICKNIVDFGFYPLDGKWNHCVNAYKKDTEENYDTGKGSIIGLVLMTIFMLLGCIIISIIGWSYHGIKKLF